MFLRSFLVAALAVSNVLSETVHSVLVFTRHGDRTAKFFKGYQMTNLGASQIYSSGKFYRQRYIEASAPSQIAGVSSDDALPSQVWASAPDQYVLYQTATNFLQGLYPPLGELNTTLAAQELVNGSSSTAPINGYQFILVHGKAETDPDTIWLKGDDACPAYENASGAYKQSIEYNTALSTSASFYTRFQPLLSSIMGAAKVSYSHAYDVFDLLNVASIHNASVASQINADDLAQLRYYANEWEWNHNYNATEPDRSIGGMTLAGGILRRLKSVVDARASTKFNLMAGSYDTFLSFFGLMNLTSASADFSGLPNYGANMVFELFSQTDNASFPTNPAQDLRVRFLFRNGTEDSETLGTYPLFGNGQSSMTYGDFITQMTERAIVTVGDWCTTCNSDEDFCLAATQSTSTPSANGSSNQSSSRSDLSNAAAGGIGAAVTLVVVAIVAALAWVLIRKRTRSPASAAHAQQKEKNLTGSETDSV